ncbi:general substrate transporter [Aspergillus ellipticus CBS 707.79]|uniref:General substrate transporter n=1 Tax=Aspergillus ellipticus CBS 707.79 TaxID=1448320 RepID=A0A319DLT0_9EURO|nr:general substrate transporter [Aspergillus ellipticus CBS 707.79]
MKYFQVPLVGTQLQIALVTLVVAPSFIDTTKPWVAVFPEIDTLHASGAEKAHRSTSQGACNASFQMGCLVGALSLYFYGDKLGRRRTIFLAAILTIIGQALPCSATTLVQLVIGRVILGFAIGQTSGTIPVWQSDMGYALCNWIDLGFSFLPSSTAQWRAPLAIPFLFSAILLISVFAFPESPRWLVSHGRKEEAALSLAQYRGKQPADTTIAREISGIKLSFESTQGSSLRDMFRKDDQTRLLYRFCLCMGLNFFQQACGGNLMSVYKSTIFQTYLGMNPTTAKILASCVLMWKTFCCLISFWAIDRWGRRLCFMISGTGMAICMAVLAMTTGLGPITHPKAIAYVAFMFIFNFFYPIGFMGGNFLYTAEVESLDVLVTPVAINTIRYGYYVIYAVISATIPICVYLFFPETMHRNLEMLDRVFVSAPSVWKVVPLARGLPREEVLLEDEVVENDKQDAAGGWG